MTGLLLLILGIVLASATALLLAASLRLPSWTSFVLAAFIAGWGMLVVEVSMLSLFGAWTRSSTIAVMLLAAAGSLAGWWVVGRPAPPPASALLAGARIALSDRIVAALSVALVLAFAYLAVIGIVVPPGAWDELLYHLPRMVIWIQRSSVAAIPDAPGTNLDANPVAAEIPQALTLLLAGTDRYVALLQLLSLPVACLAIVGVARRIGMPLPGAVFGALLFAAIPVVALQAPTGYNDLALAAALMTAAYFALGRGRAELVLFGVATALAVGTKVSGLLALPALWLFALVATTGRRRLHVAIIGLAGAIVGSWWYAYNLERTGSWDGGLADQYSQVPSRAPIDVVLRLERYAVDMFDLSGVVGRDRLVFPLVAAAVLAVGVALRRVRVAAAIAALVAITPWLVVALHEALVRTLARIWILAGRRDVIGFLPDAPATEAATHEGSFGPALVFLILLASVIAVWRTTGRTRIVYLVACLGAPVLLTLTNSGAFIWDQGRARFFLFAAALAATTFGLILRVRAVATALACVAVVTLTLSLVHFRGRAMGVDLLEPVGELVAWSAPRWEVQSAFSRDRPEVGETLRIVSEQVPSEATIAIARSFRMPLYQVMGGGPWRRTVFVRPDGSVPGEADWVALPLFVDQPLDPDTWQLVPGTGTGQAWRIYRRVGR